MKYHNQKPWKMLGSYKNHKLWKGGGKMGKRGGIGTKKEIDEGQRQKQFWKVFPRAAKDFAWHLKIIKI